MRHRHYEQIISSEVYKRNENGPKNLTCGTPNTTLTNLLRQPFTITCCDRFDKLCQYNTEPSVHRAERIYTEFPDG